MRLDKKTIIALVTAVILSIAAFTLLANALQAPEPTVPSPIQLREDAGEGGPEGNKAEKHGKSDPSGPGNGSSMRQRQESSPTTDHRTEDDNATGGDDDNNDTDDDNDDGAGSD